MEKLWTNVLLIKKVSGGFSKLDLYKFPAEAKKNNKTLICWLFKS